MAEPQVCPRCGARAADSCPDETHCYDDTPREYLTREDLLGEALVAALDMFDPTVNSRMVALIEGALKLPRLAAKPADDDVREALKPFAHTGWLTHDTEHTARTVVAHMHPESAREIILSSDDFYRAARVYAALSTKAKP